MKSILSLLVIGMLIVSCLVIPGSAEGELQNDPCLGLLEALGVTAVEDEYADDAISRAEFLSWVLAAMNESVAMSSEDPIFNDVTVKHAYYNDIVYAYQRGYIQGAGNMMFHPDDYVCLQDAIVMLLRVMGYEQIAEEKGHQVTASRLGLLKNCSGDANAPISRLEGKYMVYHALMAEAPEVMYYNEGTVRGPGMETILEVVWNMTQTHGVVEAAGAYSMFTGYQYGTNDVRIDGTIYDSQKYSVDAYFGMQVELFYTEEQGKRKLIYAYPADNRVQTFADDAWIHRNGTTLVFEEDTHEVRCKLGKDTTMFWNYKPIGSQLAYEKMGSADMEYTLIDHNQDGVYDVVMLRSAKIYSGGMIDVKNQTMTDTRSAVGTQPEPMLELGKYAEFFLFDQSGKALTMEGLKEEWRYQIYEAGDMEYPVVVAAVGQTVEGKITGYRESEGEVVLDIGETLKIAAASEVSLSELEMDKSYQFYLAGNKIIDAEVLKRSGYQAVYVMGRFLDRFGNGECKLLTEEGEQAVYKLAAKVNFTNHLGQTERLSAKEIFTQLDSFRAEMKAKNRNRIVLSNFFFVRVGEDETIRAIHMVNENKDMPYHVQEHYQMEANEGRRWLSATLTLENHIQLKSSTKIFTVPYSELEGVQQDDYYRVSGTEIFKNDDVYRINESTSRDTDPRYLQIVGTPVVLDAGAMKADYLVLECKPGMGVVAPQPKYGLVAEIYSSYNEEEQELQDVVKLLNHSGGETDVVLDFQNEGFLELGDIVQINDDGISIDQDDILLYYDRDKDKINYFSFYDKGTKINEIGWRYWAGFRVTRGKVLDIKDDLAYCEVLRDSETTKVKEYISMSKGKIISFRERKNEYITKDIGYLNVGDEFFTVMSDGVFRYVIEY